LTSLRPATLVGSSLLLGTYYFASARGGEPISGLALAAAAITLVVGSGAAQSFGTRLRSRIKSLSSRVLVLGSNLEATGRNTLSHLLQADRFVGTVAGDGNGRVRFQSPKGIETYDSIEHLLNRHAIDEVLQVEPCVGVDSATLPYLCAVRGITFRTLVRSPMGPVGRYTTERLGDGEYLLSLEMVPELGIGLTIKRVIDIVGALFGLILCGLACLMYASRIRRETEGSVLFKQIRVGRNGRLFTLYKFRTMHTTAEDRLCELTEYNEMTGHIFKMRDDPRVTPLGRILRRHYLDELPQFWNVLRGEMSLVGTRPPTQDEVAKYSAHHQRRLSMKPGVTGLWQLHGNGKVSDFEEIVKLDCGYIDNWSIWEDCKILVRTILKFCHGGGW
jgi:exopolysaccharide biosynthesis polyprenyl glycosylphosphotransferase